MLQAGCHCPQLQRELVLLIQELDDISCDLTTYLRYVQMREKFLREWLSKSSLN